ncbi:bifunctional nuclease family protein [bacterium]|nr:bifunctional nuclease family protein [bacterium]RKZ28013.1 MAG: bifunctional nuclease family protein [bacterium]
MVQGEFSFLATDVKNNEYVMIIKRKDNNRIIPIWIGSSEAFSIALVLAGLTPPRPLTHDLIVDIITALGAKLKRIVITGLKNSTFYALLHIERGDVETYVVDARPSDSIAIALRTKCEILISEDIETFDIEIPATEIERELAERLRKIDPKAMIRF